MRLRTTEFFIEIEFAWEFVHSFSDDKNGARWTGVRSESFCNDLKETEFGVLGRGTNTSH